MFTWNMTGLPEEYILDYTSRSDQITGELQKGRDANIVWERVMTATAEL